MTISIDDLTTSAADDLLDEHGIERTSADPLEDFIDQLGNQPREWTTRSGLRALARHAIGLDRDQRDLVTITAEVLDERGANAAAELVRQTDPQDDLWNNYLDPMLDELEEDYTRMATGLRQ